MSYSLEFLLLTFKLLNFSFLSDLILIPLSLTATVQLLNVKRKLSRSGHSLLKFLVS